MFIKPFLKGFLLPWIILMLLFSCSDAKLLKKAHKRGLVTTSVKIDTLTTVIDGDTVSIVYLDTITKYVASPTRYETRWRYKTIRDTIKIRGKERIKIVKENNESKENIERIDDNIYMLGLFLLALLIAFVLWRLI